MPLHIKRARLAGQQEETDAKVPSTVETIIADVARRGDEAVRELSERFDKWSPPSFRPSDDEIAALVARVAPETIDDIKFDQAQIHHFAEIQRASLRDRGDASGRCRRDPRSGRGLGSGGNGARNRVVQAGRYAGPA